MTETQTFEDKCRVAARHYYVKTHAPGILAALIKQNPLVIAEPNDPLVPMYSPAQLRAQAIEQAGLLFDELEPK